MKIQEAFINSSAAAACVLLLNTTTPVDVTETFENLPEESTSIGGQIFDDDEMFLIEQIEPEISNSSESEVTSSSKNIELETIFNELAQKWKGQTGASSSVASLVMHPAYLQIISYGDKMIPYILQDLQKKPSHWFIALKILAKNYSPVKPEDAGNIKKMTDAWLNWGMENGYIT